MTPTGYDSSTVIVLYEGVRPADIRRLYEEMRRALEKDQTSIVICDVGSITQPDATIVDAIARLQLTARRMDCVLHLKDVCPRLRELLDLAGLADVIPICGD